MSRREFPTNRRPEAMYTLDLHGYTKPEGVCRTTELLDRTSRLIKNSENAWVLIITGTGAHSSNGPVLRSAIEALLVKRKIDYHKTKCKGSFLVNAASGFALYDLPQPIDSKVIIAPNSSSNSSNNVIRLSKNGQYSTLTPNISESTRGSRKELKRSFYKRFNEEIAFGKAISESMEETNKMNEEEEKEKELLERAFSLSLLDKQKEKQEEEKLYKVIEFSKRESILQSMDEQEQIQKAMELSNIEFDYHNDPDACLQRAMELSRKECKQADNEMLMMLDEIALKQTQDKQEDEDFLQALELSVAEFVMG